MALGVGAVGVPGGARVLALANALTGVVEAELTASASGGRMGARGMLKGRKVSGDISSKTGRIGWLCPRSGRMKS